MAKCVFGFGTNIERIELKSGFPMGTSFTIQHSNLFQIISASTIKFEIHLFPVLESQSPWINGMERNIAISRVSLDFFSCSYTSPQDAGELFEKSVMKIGKSVFLSIICRCIPKQLCIMKTIVIFRISFGVRK